MTRPKSILALKLTDTKGFTRHGFIRLKIGKRVRRALPYNEVTACNASAVHAYAHLAQARLYDRSHCNHGRRGIIWLVRLARPVEDLSWYGSSKTLGTSYVVLRKIGRMGAPSTTTKCRQLKLAVRRTP